MYHGILLSWNAAWWYSAYLACRRLWVPFPALKKIEIKSRLTNILCPREKQHVELAV
jgi:hypothetical protein